MVQSTPKNHNYGCMKLESIIKLLSEQEFVEILRRIKNDDRQQEACQLIRYWELSVADVIRLRAKDVTVEGIQLPQRFINWSEIPAQTAPLRLKLLEFAQMADLEERLFETRKPVLEGVWDLEHRFLQGWKDWQTYQDLAELDISARLPNFLVLGTPKSATTWLHSCLRVHPEIFVPAKKELEFWGTHHYYRGINWYKRHFVDWHDQKKGGEVSVSYFASPTAPEQISKQLDWERGSLKLIVILREPLSRALSCYAHWVLNGEAPRTFEEALKIGFFRKQLCHNLHYYRHYERYLKFFSAEQILIVLFDDIKKNPLAVLSRVFDFLEVQSDYCHSIFAKKVNVGCSVKNLTLHYWLYHTGVFCQHILPEPMGDTATTILKKINQRVNVSPTKFKPLIDQKLYQRLKDEFRPSNQRLADLTGLDLSAWN